MKPPLLSPHRYNLKFLQIPQDSWHNQFNSIKAERGAAQFMPILSIISLDEEKPFQSLKNHEKNATAHTVHESPRRG